MSVAKKEKPPMISGYMPSGLTERKLTFFKGVGRQLVIVATHHEWAPQTIVLDFNADNKNVSIKQLDSL